MPSCERTIEGKQLRFTLVKEPAAEDEVMLSAIEVHYGSEVHLLSVEPDTTLLSGDKGYLSYPDINFDAVPDLAITTSFGTPNLYMDYWIYQPIKGAYNRIGNFPQFQIDHTSQTLSAQIKSSAQAYETRLWQWRDGELVERDSKQAPIDE